MGKNLILLASKSLRRRNLLKRIVPSEMIIVIGSEIAEELQKNESAETFCMRVAQEKAADVWGRYAEPRNDIAAVIGADTVILFKGNIIGQPKNNEDAIRILKQLSGECHEVVTGVAVLYPTSNRVVTFIVKSKVWMYKLSQETIEAYVATGEPMDKAGAYGIQGKGKRLIERYEGSYSNIVGLPVDELKKVLNCPQ